MHIPIEDTYTDVVAKAARGRGADLKSLAAEPATLDAFLEGAFDEALARKLASALDLNAEALVALGSGSYQPAEVTLPEGVAHFNTPYHDMTVNSFLLWDPSSQEAAFIDTGADCDPALQAVAARAVRPGLLLLTHSHGDHVLELDRLVEKSGAAAWISENEPLEGAAAFAPGKIFPVGSLRVTSLSTPGHSPGGITYLVEGLSTPVAFVGDALFAGSAGGPNTSYADVLHALRTVILSLPDDTILCPGHGPLTTVAEQKRHNPFYVKSL